MREVERERKGKESEECIEVERRRLILLEIKEREICL